ncbi:MAG: FMN-binding negative transcriptional regulator [Oceanococcus sp.]
MYTPKHFAESDPGKIAALIRDNAFGALVSVVDHQSEVTHTPFLYDQEAGLLLGHVARANPHWESLDSAQDVLVIFQGPHAYVSPSWYSGSGVPTWNYAAVHVRGSASTFDDVKRLQTLVEALSHKYESQNDEPWLGPYNPRMLGNIVGIEISITEIQGKFKLSQNKSAVDRAAVSSQLQADGPSEGQRLAQLMDENEDC